MLHWIAQHICETNDIIRLLSGKLIFENYLYFVAGFCFKKSETYDMLVRLYTNKFLQVIVFLLAFLPYFCEVQWYIRNVCSLFLVVTIFHVFKFYRAYFQTNAICSRLLKTLGVNTLEIYFIHYFLLFRVDYLCDLLTRFSTDYCFRGNSCQFLVELCLIGAFSVFIAMAAILIAKLLRPFQIVRKLCFGK